MAFNFAPRRNQTTRQPRTKFFVGIASPPSKLPNEPSTLFAPHEIHKLCDEYARFRVDNPGQCIGLVKEHEDDSLAGQYLMPFCTTANALGVIGRLDASTPFGAEMIRDVQTKNRLGLSLKTHTVLDLQKDKLAEHGIHHLGIVKHPCWKEMTWITQTADDFNAIMQSFKDKWVDAGQVGYMSDFDRSIYDNWWGQKRWADFDAAGEAEAPQIFFSHANPMQAYSRLDPMQVCYENECSEGVPQKVTVVAMADNSNGAATAAEEQPMAIVEEEEQQQKQPQAKKTAAASVSNNAPPAAAPAKKMTTPQPTSNTAAAAAAAAKKSTAPSAQVPGRQRDPAGRYAKPGAPAPAPVQDADVDMTDGGDEQPVVEEINAIPEGSAGDGMDETGTGVGEQEDVADARANPGKKRSNTDVYNDGNNSSSLANRQGLPTAKRQKQGELSDKDRRAADAFGLKHDKYMEMLEYSNQFGGDPAMRDASLKDMAAAYQRERLREAEEKKRQLEAEKKQKADTDAEYQRMAQKLLSDEYKPHVPQDAMDFITRAASNPGSLGFHEPPKLFNLLSAADASLTAMNQKRQEMQMQKQRKQYAEQKRHQDYQWAHDYVQEQVGQARSAGVKYSTNSPALEQQQQQKQKQKTAAPVAPPQKKPAPASTDNARQQQSRSNRSNYQNIDPSERFIGTGLASAEEVANTLKPGYEGMNALTTWTTEASAGDDDNDDGMAVERDEQPVQRLPDALHKQVVTLGKLHAALHGDQMLGGLDSLKAYAGTPNASKITYASSQARNFPSRLAQDGRDYFDTRRDVLGRPVVGEVDLGVVRGEHLRGFQVDLTRRVGGNNFY